MSKRVDHVVYSVATLSLMLLAACAAPRSIGGFAPDPRKGEVRLAAAGDFDAYLAHRSDVGIWTVRSLQVFDRYGCPQIVALDDRGRCTILNSYSGKWTPWDAVQDGQWLGGVALEDVDPRQPGKELYVGGKRGNLYQIKPLRQGGFDTNVVAYLPGREIHTLIAGDLDPDRAGKELLIFTRPGGLYLLEPPESPELSFGCRHIQDLPGRVRDAVLLDDGKGVGLAVATVSRAGEVALLRFESSQPVWTTVDRIAMGLGRIAVKPSRADEALVFYVTVDDGRILRYERARDGSFREELIHAGPQGPRGLAAGRFHEDPDKEAVAIFGYSRKVQLLTRDEGHWEVETIFEDTDKGHWLATAELDGRNGTDELIASGYGARVILLTRPPGYGLNTRGASTAP